MPKPAVQTTMRIDPQVYADAREAAARAGQSFNTWVERAIAQAVAAEKAAQRQGRARRPEGGER